MTPTPTLPRLGPAATWLARWFGMRVRSVTAVVSVGTSSAVLLQGDPNCLAIFMQNIGANNIFVVPADAGNASASNGILLAPNGGALSVAVQNDGDLSEHTWNAIAATGATNLMTVKLVAY